MPERSPIQAYLETVASQIRWKRARPVVTQELARHLEDQRDAFAAEGRENAEQMAVAEMGDPVKLGVELDSLHRPAPQYGLLALTILFALSGAVLRIWLTADWAPSNLDADPQKTLLAWGLGCAALLEVCFLDDPDDMAVYTKDKAAVAAAIARGICEGFGLDIPAQAAPAPWYADAQAWAMEMGIADGSRPTDPAIHAEVWTMLHRMSQRM